MTFDFGAHIRESRKSLGLTQVELAERAGIHQGDLSRIERGESDPRWSTVGRLSAALGEVLIPDRPATQRRQRTESERAATHRRARSTRLNRDAADVLPIKR